MAVFLMPVVDAMENKSAANYKKTSEIQVKAKLIVESGNICIMSVSVEFCLFIMYRRFMEFRASVGACPSNAIAL
jgi:hypothetical protein